MKAVLFIAIITVFSFSAFAQSEPLPSPTVEEVYLAKDDGTGKAGGPVTEFRSNDVPIYCVVILDTTSKVTVKMNFVAVAVAGVKPETKVVSASYTTKDGQNRVNFSGRPDAKWTPGTYRVDLYIDGKPAGNVEFVIKNAAAGVNTSANSFRPASVSKPRPAKKAR